MFLKIFLFYLIFCFFNEEKLKKTMSRKKGKFYVINFIDHGIIFLKRTF